MRQRLRWNRLAQYIGNMRLQTKMVVSYILVILIPILIFSSYMSNNSYNNTIHDTIQSNQYLLDVEYNKITNNIDLMERTAQLMLLDNKVLDYLVLKQEMDTLSLMDFSRNVLPDLVRLQFNNPNIAHIRMYFNNPYTKELWPIFLDEKRIANAPWKAELMERNGMELWVFDKEDRNVMSLPTSESFEKEKPKVSLLRQISYGTDKDAGIVQIDMYLDDFFSRVQPDEQERQSRLLLLDRESQFFYHDKTSFVDNIPLDDLEQRIRSASATEATHFEADYNGVPYIIIFKKIDLLDAFIISAVSLEEPLHAIRDTVQNLIIVSVVLIAILSLVTYLLSRIIFKRLRMLQNSMNRVRNGDLQVNIDVSGGGEVGEIALHFKMLMKKINSLIVDAVNKQAAAKEAELNAMKNQIDSHFMYNTLENLKMLAEVEGQYVLSDALTSLGRMMRYNLQWTSNYVRLRDEVHHIQNYIAIMNIRYDDRISLQLFVPPAYMEHEILKMSLQPIVENAIKHGLYTNEQGEELPLVLSIRVHEANDHMLIELMDNGKGMDAERVNRINYMIRLNDADFRQVQGAIKPGEEKGNGIGLRNVNQRVKMNYGNDYGIQVQSVEGQYTTVSIKLPTLLFTKGDAGHAETADRG
ncbi:sensor histidine kinase [Paenibacillus pinisoli]|uniref:histidine kinase n=1 Tax=Paenibacillus pinisoli TaxID=1276110 RepID=A0A3A6Q254_9BACL|nr:sensor histidine kinase [Paenibacillus pinisoli]RJX41553.1 sensor histidine kinase [Paenibacillus pinisoli]